MAAGAAFAVTLEGYLRPFLASKTWVVVDSLNIAILATWGTVDALEHPTLWKAKNKIWGVVDRRGHRDRTGIIVQTLFAFLFSMPFVWSYCYGGGVMADLLAAQLGGHSLVTDVFAIRAFRYHLFEWFLYLSLIHI